MNRALIRTVQPARQALMGVRFQSQYKAKLYVDPEPQIGDYPNLPQRFAEDRPQRGWWDRQMRRNFGEPILEQDEIFNMWAPTRYASPGWKRVTKMWLGVIGTIGTVYYVISKTRPEPVAVRAFYPGNGLKEELGGVATRTIQDSVEEASA
ncbi:hypothetical protein EC988_009203 [Linderina pennispora]|nr:hypothetical protein EC988_009203 [Linderina pennispora]